ncbi:unnamed protein product [Spodoptera exigua]|nr:unnamed protein product [Spodoptera exigua]
MPSDSGSAWSPPASNSERRLSNSSDGSAGSGYSKANPEPIHGRYSGRPVQCCHGQSRSEQNVQPHLLFLCTCRPDSYRADTLTSKLAY